VLPREQRLDQARLDQDGQSPPAPAVPSLFSTLPAPHRAPPIVRAALGTIVMVWPAPTRQDPTPDHVARAPWRHSIACASSQQGRRSFATWLAEGMATYFEAVALDLKLTIVEVGVSPSPSV
jgi:hypothetical protein